MPRKKLRTIALSDEELAFLEKEQANESRNNTERKRCAVLLEMDVAHGKDNTILECARKVGVGKATVSNIVRLYFVEGLESAVRFKRNPISDTAHQKMSAAEDELIYQLADSPPPEGRKRWTMRLLAEKSGEILHTPVSKDSICRALKRRHKG